MFRSACDIGAPFLNNGTQIYADFPLNTLGHRFTRMHTDRYPPLPCQGSQARDQDRRKTFKSSMAMGSGL